MNLQPNICWVRYVSPNLGVEARGIMFLRLINTIVFTGMAVFCECPLLGTWNAPEGKPSNSLHLTYAKVAQLLAE